MFQFWGSSTLGYIRTPSLLVWVFDAFGGRSGNLLDSDGAAGLLMPLVVLGIFWMKRRELVGLELKLWTPALAVVVAGLLVHVLGYLVQQPRVSVVGLFTGIYGLMGLAWGWAWLRASFFPFFLLGFCVPLGSLADPITFKLRLLVCQLSQEVCQIIAIDVIRNGTTLSDPSGTYNYDVAAACSGIRSLFATLALSVIFAFFFFKTWWRRLLLLASAFPLAVLGNLLRLLSIIIAAEIGGQSWGHAVHDGGPYGVFSLLPYVPAFAGLFALEHFLREPKPKPAPVREEAGK